MSEATLRILVVDDSESSRSLVRRMLKRIGSRVDEATDGFEAIVRMRENRYDVALIDIGMPHMNGYDLCRRLRNDVNLQTKLIACTAHATPDELAKMSDARFDCVLTKPFLMKELYRAIGADPG